MATVPTSPHIPSQNYGCVFLANIRNQSSGTGFLGDDSHISGLCSCTSDNQGSDVGREPLGFEPTPSFSMFSLSSMSNNDFLVYSSYRHYGIETPGTTFIGY
jgi:hypothetical protein